MFPSNTITIEEFIQTGRASEGLNYKTFSFLENTSNDTEVTILDVIDDYIDEIRDACIKVKLSDDEFRKYAYKPKLLCYDIYGNPELYFIILLINDIADVKEFDMKKFLMLPKDSMSILTSAIYNAERPAIEMYNDRSVSDKPGV